MKYQVNLWTNRGNDSRVIHTGNDETIMYSHVNTLEYTLMAVHGTADIEIVEDGESRWIDYQDGKRV